MPELTTASDSLDECGKKEQIDLKPDNGFVEFIFASGDCTGQISKKIAKNLYIPGPVCFLRKFPKSVVKKQAARVYIFFIYWTLSVFFHMNLYL